jgi:hypothetical protein
MPVRQLVLDVDSDLFGRIVELAAANRCSVEEMALHMIRHSVGLHDYVTGPEFLREQQEREARLKTLRASRPQLSPELRAMVEDHKGTRTPTG